MKQVSQQLGAAGNREYRCLDCDGELRVNEGKFVHIDGSDDCWGSSTMTDEHQLAKEAAAIRLSRLLGTSRSINSEGRVGTARDFVIGDVIADWPEQYAVEVVHACSHLGLPRKLTQLYEEGFSVFLVVVESGRYNPDKLDQHLRKASGFRQLEVGRFDPSRGISLGTKLTPAVLPPDRLCNEAFPQYLR
jgi:hypothetical protein